jgi:hypothetical protein
MHIHTESKIFSSLCENQTIKTRIRSIGAAVQNNPSIKKYATTQTDDNHK